MPKTPGPCGCSIESVRDDNEDDGWRDFIVYCPTHAAAPALLAAGERVLHDVTRDALDNLRAAIAQTSGPSSPSTRGEK